MDTAGVKAIAHLARIGVEDHEIADYAKHLTDLIHLIDKIDQADTSQVEPLYHPLDAEQRLRDDEITENDQRTVLMQNAPEQQDGLFLVPKVIEEA